MNAHTNIARDLLATGEQDLQDAYRVAWMKGIPRHLRKPIPKPVDTGPVNPKTQAAAKKAAETRWNRTRQKWATITPEVKRLSEQGMNIRDLAIKYGVSPGIIREIREQTNTKAATGKGGHNRLATSELSVIMPKVDWMRGEGMSYREIAERVGRHKDTVRKYHRQWQKEAQA